MSDQLSKLCLYALNYDLLLQYPIHRQYDSVKIHRPLKAETDEALIAEETLTVEAFDLIEALYKTEKAGTDSSITKQQENRLKRLLPLLLYRYRPCDQVQTVIEENGATGEPMIITKDRQQMQVLPFNFRPFNTGLKYANWPLGRTQELVITEENHQEPGAEKELLTNDHNVHYVAEPVDKLEWLSSKRSVGSDEPFNVAKFYENTDLFFLKYAPRARMIRKARFRSPRPESTNFRNFLFETQFYRNNDPVTAQTWDSTWKEYLHDLLLSAHLLVLMQPLDVTQFSFQSLALARIFAFATYGWTAEQRHALNQICRATPYEKNIDADMATKTSIILHSAIENTIANSIQNTRLGAAALALFVGLQTRFTAYQGDIKGCFNAIYRIVLSIEQSINIEQSVHDSYLNNWQLWYLAKQLVVYLQSSDLQLGDIEFVSQFLQFAVQNYKLFSKEALEHDLQSVSSVLPLVSANLKK